MLTVLESTSKVGHRVCANNTGRDKMRVKTISGVCQQSQWRSPVTVYSRWDILYISFYQVYHATWSFSDYCGYQDRRLYTDRGVTRLKLGVFIFACCAAGDFVNSDHPGHQRLRISSCHQNGDGERLEKCSEVDIYILCFRKYCCFCQAATRCWVFVFKAFSQCFHISFWALRP